MKRNMIHLFTTLFVMCVCNSVYAQDVEGRYTETEAVKKLQKVVGRLIEEEGKKEKDEFSSPDQNVVSCWEKGLQEVEKEYGAISNEMFDCYSYAGNELFDASLHISYKSQLGYSCYLKALDISKKLYGKDSAIVGHGYCRMVYACGPLSEDAEQYADSALVILKNYYDEQSPDVARVYWALGYSYPLNNDDVYRVAAQFMMNTGSEYFDESFYEEIISNCEKSNENFKKAYDIYAGLGDEYKEYVDMLKEYITIQEQEIKDNKEELKKARAQK